MRPLAALASWLALFALCSAAWAQPSYVPSTGATTPLPLREGPGEGLSSPRSRTLWEKPRSAGVSATPHPAVVRVVAPGRDTISYGSGTLVAISGQHGLVVTNWHVVNEATGQISVVFADGFRSGGTVVKVDRDWDLAAIAIWKPNVEPIRLASMAPQPGEPLAIAGYGSGQYRATSGKCTQYVAPGERFPFEMVELSASARQGDSGGPILNSRGELAGVLFGEGGGRTAGSYCGRVQWFLDSIVPQRPAGGDSMIAAVSDQPLRPQARSRGTPAETVAQTSARPIAIDAPTMSAADRNANDAQLASSPRGSAGELAEPPLIAGRPQPAAAQPGTSQTLGWREIAGDTVGEQLKTVLAAIGSLAVVVCTLRLVGGEAPPSDQKKDKDKGSKRHSDDE